LLLKGHNTIIGNKTDLYVNLSGNSGMATAGSGDVLSGMIAAFLAQKLSGINAAKIAAYIHGISGDIAESYLTKSGITASDIVNNIPNALAYIEKN